MNQLLSSGGDGLVKLWTVRSNECETTLDGHSDKVWAMDVAQGMKTFVSGGADSRIVVWSDITEQSESAIRETQEKNLLAEERLADHVRHKDYEKALELALQLNKPMQVLNVRPNLVVRVSVPKVYNSLHG